MAHNLTKGVEPIQATTVDTGSVVLLIPAGVVEHFKNLIRKGSNTWPKAPIEIKEFVSRFANDVEPGDHYRNHAVYKSAEQLNERQPGATINTRA